MHPIHWCVSCPMYPSSARGRIITRDNWTKGTMQGACMLSQCSSQWDLSCFVFVLFRSTLAVISNLRRTPMRYMHDRFRYDSCTLSNNVPTFALDGAFPRACLPCGFMASFCQVITLLPSSSSIFQYRKLARQVRTPLPPNTPATPKDPAVLKMRLKARCL